MIYYVMFVGDLTMTKKIYITTYGIGLLIAKDC